jgi:hypothetical protein
VSGHGTDDDGAGAADRDLPADVEATLTQLLGSAADHARERDVESVRSLVDTVERVARNKVPEGPLRDRLLYGCATADRLAPDEPLVAAEYFEAMARLVAS